MHRQFGLDIISLRYWGTPLGQRLPLTNFEVFIDKTWRTLPHNTHRHYKVGGEFRPLKLTRLQIILYCRLHFANTNCLPSRMFRGYTRRGATAKSTEFRLYTLQNSGQANSEPRYHQMAATPTTAMVNSVAA